MFVREDILTIFKGEEYGKIVQIKTQRLVLYNGYLNPYFPYQIFPPHVWSAFGIFVKPAYYNIENSVDFKPESLNINFNERWNDYIYGLHNGYI